MPDASPSFSSEAAVSFVVYTGAVFVLAFFSHRLLRGRSFLKEYFLGSRGLGFWALAMTYAATSASGGSFTGFPALIYTHGWVLALWIASYMVVPICALGMLGKRLNQVARKSGAITIPDVFRDRFRSDGVGVLASVLLVVFLVFNLCAQFKAGAKIIERLLDGSPILTSIEPLVAWMPETFSFLSASQPTASYCAALVIFGAAVIAYTMYGGFRAVVWTDVLQGIVMFFGVLLLLGFTLAKIPGGLETATRGLAEVRLVTLDVESSSASSVRIPARATVAMSLAGAEWELSTERGRTLDEGGSLRVATRVLTGGELPSDLSAAEFSSFFAPPAEESGERARIAAVRVSRATHDPKHNLVSAPGYSASSELGFLPLSLAFSFFAMWALSGTGQPTTMVRLMAFSSSSVLRRSIFCVSLYYTLIYVPLVVIFVCARYVLPPLDDPDSAMPRMVLAMAPGWIAGIILAAPFAAVMSTVDSFLLAISSGVVRDIYQRSIRPNASATTIRRLSYLATLVVGLVAMFGALNPPEYLQNIIVLTGAGLSSTFLAPMFFSLYWKRMTAYGVYAGMLGGFLACSVLYVLGWSGVGGEAGGTSPYRLLNFEPLVWGILASALGSAYGSLAGPRPPRDLVDKYFAAPSSGDAS